MTRSTVPDVPRVRGWIWWALSAVLLSLIPVPATTVERYYSRGVFPHIQFLITAISNLIPFAVLDLLMIVTTVMVVYRIGRVVRTSRQLGVALALADLGKRLVRLAGVVLTVFLVFWGWNYRRQPLESSLPAGAAELTVNDLAGAIAAANVVGVRTRPDVPGDASMTYAAIADRLVTPMNAALDALHRPRLARPGRPKTSPILTPFFERAGVSGMIDPLALESILDSELLPFERPFVLAHEWGHLAGAADEAEASAIGWFACMHGDAGLAYSASIYLIEEAAAAMPRQARQEALSSLDPGIRADLVEIAQRAARRQQPQVQHAASQVYDHYLKANRVADGNASYSRALSLILAEPLSDALKGTSR